MNATGEYELLRSELYLLADRCLADEATAVEVERFESLVRGDSRACAEYIDFIRDSLKLRSLFDVPLSSGAEEGWRADQVDREPGESRFRRGWSIAYQIISNYMALSMLVSGLVITTILLSLALWQVPQWRPEVIGGRPEFVAQITATQQATWDKSSDGNFKNLDLLAGERLMLNNGLAEVTFDDGATVVLEGPCQFTVAGSGSGSLAHGKLLARVPKRAVGFIIDTPAMRIVDLGTEFGVEVAADGTSQVAVLDGEVEVVGEASAAGTKQRMRLAAGEAASVDPTSGTITLKSDDQGTRFANLTAGRRAMQHTTLLRVDFQNSSGKNIPAVTQPGFVAMTDQHATGPGTASATFATRNGRVTVSLSGLNSHLDGFFNRNPGFPDSDALTAAALYNDFAFKNGSGAQSLQLTLSGEGISANTDYLLTFYSYDAGDTRGNAHTVVCEGIGGTAGSAPPIMYATGTHPQSNHQYATTGTFTSDDSGTLTVRLSDTIVGRQSDGIRLNAVVLGVYRFVD